MAGYSPDSDPIFQLWSGGSAVPPPSAPGQPAKGYDPSLDPIFNLWSGGSEAPPEEQAPGTGSAGRAFAGGMVEGLPIVGPAAYGLMRRTVAGLRATSADSKGYAAELKYLEGLDAAEAKAHPVAKKAGEVTGGVAGLVAGGATVAGGKALGMAGETLLGRMAAGAASGGVISAADTAARGLAGPGDIANRLLAGDVSGPPIESASPQDIALSAGFGTVFGGGAPVVGKLAGKGIEYLFPWVKSPTPTAAAGRAIFKSLDESGTSPQEVKNALIDNPGLAPVDVNIGMLGKGQGIALQPGTKGQKIISDFVNNRAAMAKTSVGEAIDRELGPEPDVKALLEGIIKKAKANAKTGFGAALNGAGPVDLKPVAAFVDSKISPRMVPGTSLGLAEQELQRVLMTKLIELPNKAGMQKAIAKEATRPDGSVDQAIVDQIMQRPEFAPVAITDVNRLHEIQQELRIKGETMLEGQGQERLAGKALLDLRRVINDQIDKATGGKFKPAQKKFADDMSIKDAFAKGIDIFRNRAGMTGIEDRPEYLRAWLDDASAPEKEAYRQAVRVATDQLVRSTRWAVRNGAKLPDVDFNAEKLRMVMGNDEANRMFRDLGNEVKKAMTNVKLLEGSQTAIREAAKKAVGVPDDIKKMNWNISTMAVLTSWLQKLGKTVYAAHVGARNALIAKAITDPVAFGKAADKGARAAARRGRVIEGANRVGNALTRTEAPKDLPGPLKVYVGQPAEGYQ